MYVGLESKESKSETDDNSLDKVCSPDVEHLNNCTCDKPPIPNYLNNINCVCIEASVQAGEWFKCIY